MKIARFHAATKKVIREFPKPVKIELGNAITALQMGEKLKMPLSRPMPSIGRGVAEIRIKDATGEYRSFYFCNLEKEILIFHAFVKKSQKTPNLEIELGRKRLKELLP